ncbi:competence protein ComEA [Salinibacillus kushneri]|uniref:Competence protein ComEA n=1 Tax=Salinibacillus kushneri TaxID=237682 RepID=A0A1I0G3N1_9BACI|nr:helix-hairpin-helix domain-containing protein [Salinibacillus kushneri]SET65338.1 competence protein ComEA [Salinibacillus kushneri]
MKVNKQLLWKLWLGSILVIFILIVIFTSNNQSDMSVVQKENVNSDMDLESEQEKDSITAAEEETKDLIMVDIKGAVQKPGVYELSADSRVNDVISLAGGLSEKADPLSVNLAERVYDEMAIVVLEANEDRDSKQLKQAKNDKIRINQASAEELMQLKGIGEAKAEAIIQYREDHGLFQNEEDLVNVSGIGEKTIENLKDQILVP